MQSVLLRGVVVCLAVLAGLPGCEKAPTWDDLTGNDRGSATPDSAREPARTVETLPPRTNPPPASADSVVRTIQALQPHEITDEHLRQLTSLETGLEALTELNLERSRVTAAGLVEIEKLRWLKSFNLSRMPVTAEILRKLEAMTELEVLKLNYCPLDDDMLASLENLTSLRELTLNQTQITDAGFKHFAKLVQLEAIDVSSCAIDGSGFAVFAAWKDACRIREIVAHHTQFGVKGPKHVSGWGSLERLILSQAGVEDRVLGDIERCENLRDLDLSFNNVSDAGIKRIDKLKHVSILRLNNNRGVSDTSLAAIRHWSELRTLELDKTSCSLRGVQSLKQNLPDVKISWNGQEF